MYVRSLVIRSPSLVVQLQSEPDFFEGSERGEAQE